MLLAVYPSAVFLYFFIFILAPFEDNKEVLGRVVANRGTPVWKEWLDILFIAMRYPQSPPYQQLNWAGDEQG